MEAKANLERTKKKKEKKKRENERAESEWSTVQEIGGVEWILHDRYDVVFRVTSWLN